jgi:diaminohydroxyphosphoribosylaminopyrimidine deaminase/5-amino-6-(5-phosphoribosylamino)uracil reductase
MPRHSRSRRPARARAGATAYVTLEPCNHHGRTPPCTEALIAAGVARVVYAVDDPDPRVDGGGAARLRAAGRRRRISGCWRRSRRRAESGILLAPARGRPWVRLKLAASLDGRTALASGESQLDHRATAARRRAGWRAQSAAMLTGVGTVLADDPALTVRIGDEPRPRQPLRVVLDSRLRTPRRRARAHRPGRAACSRATTSMRSGGEASLPRTSSSACSRCRRDGRVAAAVLRPLARSARSTRSGSRPAPRSPARCSARRLFDELVVYLAPTLLGPDARPLAQRLPTRSAGSMIVPPGGSTTSGHRWAMPVSCCGQEAILMFTGIIQDVAPCAPSSRAAAIVRLIDVVACRWRGDAWPGDSICVSGAA